MKKILIVGIAIVVIVAVWAFVKSGPTTVPATNSPVAEAPAITGSDHARGNASATVTLIEYGDFQCPACGAYHPIMQQLESEYADRVLFVFRNFPLTNIHDSAQYSAEAAEAAGLQGKYWEMHDWLYENQLKWATLPLTARTIIEAHASSMGLNMDRFKKDLESDAVKGKITADVEGANGAGIQHTPTFFVNLKSIPNPTSLEDFKSVLDKALGK